MTLDELQHLSGTKMEVVKVYVDMDKKEPKQIHVAIVLKKEKVANLVKIQRFFGADEVKLLSLQEAEDIVRNE